MTYAAAQLVDEVAYVAYYFHWSLASILQMEHPKRRAFIEAIGSINRQVNDGDGDGRASGSSPGFVGAPADPIRQLLEVR